MIVVRVLGGLGNQLFQYAAGRRLAEAHGTSLALDLSGFPAYGLRRYELGALNVEASLPSLPEIEAWARERAQRGIAVGYVKEPHFHFYPGLLVAPADAFLEGYWQSERYFADIAGLLRRELSLQAPLEGANRDLLDRIGGVEAVSLHVRRSDYVTNPRVNAKHGTCGLEYYDAAIARIRERVERPHFFVFSDDPAWAAENLGLRIPAPAVFVTGNAGNGVLDLTLMRHCRHHILANSTFSWWAAWLCDHAHKLVIAPRRWFVATDLDTIDLIPAGWERI